MSFDRQVAARLLLDGYKDIYFFVDVCFFMIFFNSVAENAEYRWGEEGCEESVDGEPQ